MLPALCLLGISSLLGLADTAPPAGTKTLLDMGEGAEKRVTPTSSQVTVTRSEDAAAPGIVVTIAPGKEGYPGINLTAGAPWDLSKYGHVEARVTNTGEKAFSLNLRIDDDGPWQDNPWNAESVYLKQGASATLKTIFGYSYGFHPGHDLNSSKIVRLMLFTGKASAVQSFRLESIVAAGPAGEKPPVDPKSIRITPQGGFLFGHGAPFDAATQMSSKSTQAALDGTGAQQTLRVNFPAAKEEKAKTAQTVTLKPAEGRWDLRAYLQVRLSLRNDGQSAITPRARLASNKGATDWVAGSALAPGATEEIVVPFASAEVADLEKKGSGTHFGSDAVSGVEIGADQADSERVLAIESVKAELQDQSLPAWLGQRPPVEGDWVKTFDEEFDGTTLNESLWSIYGANYWDKKSHWSKDNVLLGDGVVKLRYEKKTGFNNDDPTQKETGYASGYLHTYDKWSQKYGYFEARMKLPKAPGLWPAFWLMPDRGAAGGPEQWRRQMTENGGMEFDIMEHLTRWGPNRYSIAMHWDGYGKNHKSNGADCIYLQPDKDGYITCGLLWTPGLAVFYGNGHEVLRWENPRIANVPEMLMFTLPAGGWDNNALDDKQLPDDFAIDYVRVWQRKDLAPDAAEAKP
jgi:beta-glucanase (GH16 family)